jgi:hypothetical protein
VTNLVRKLTWVEGSRFNVSNIGNDVLFEAWMPTKDSRVERDVDLYTHAVLPNDVLEQMTNGQILVAIRQILIGSLAHESDEWLLFNGERIFDPHAA